MKLQNILFRNFGTLGKGELALKPGLSVLYVEKNKLLEFEKLFEYLRSEGPRISEKPKTETETDNPKFSDPILCGLTIQTETKTLQYLKALQGEKVGLRLQIGDEKFSEINAIREAFKLHLNLSLAEFLSEIIANSKLNQISSGSNVPLEKLISQKSETSNSKIPAVQKKISDTEVLISGFGDRLKKISETSSKLATLSSSIKKTGDRINELKFIAESKSQREKLELEKSELELKEKELSEKLGGSAEKRKNSKQKKRALESMKYFSTNPPKTLIPKIDALIRNEETIEKTYEEKKIELIKLEKELDSLNLESEKISNLLLNPSLPQLKVIDQELEKLKVKLSEFENKKIGKSQQNFLQDTNFLLTLGVSALFLISGVMFEAYFLSILGIIFVLVYLAVNSGGGNAQSSRSQNIKSFTELVEKKKAEKLKLLESANFGSIEEFETVEKNSEGIDIKIKTKAISVENLRSDLLNKIKPKLDKFLAEKEKVLKESTYSDLKTIKTKAEEYKKLKTEVDDLEFEMMRFGNGPSNKETERELDKVEDKILKLKDDLAKLETSNASSEEIEKAVAELKEIEPPIAKQKTDQETLQKELDELKKVDLEKLKVDLNTQTDILKNLEKQESSLKVAISVLESITPQNVTSSPKIDHSIQDLIKQNLTRNIPLVMFDKKENNSDSKFETIKTLKTFSDKLQIVFVTSDENLKQNALEIGANLLELA